METVWNFVSTLANILKSRRRLKTNFTITEEPQGTSEFCPRKNGFFSHPDPAICNIFYSCINGEELEMNCMGGLHFDEKTGNCAWADIAARVGCGSNSNSKYP